MKATKYIVVLLKTQLFNVLFCNHIYNGIANKKVNPNICKLGYITIKKTCLTHINPILHCQPKYPLPAVWHLKICMGLTVLDRILEKNIHTMRAKPCCFILSGHSVRAKRYTTNSVGQSLVVILCEPNCIEQTIFVQFSGHIVLTTLRGLYALIILFGNIGQTVCPTLWNTQ